MLTEHHHDKNDPMGLIQEDPELFVRPKLNDGKQKSFLHMGMRTTEEVTSGYSDIWTRWVCAARYGMVFGGFHPSLG